MSPDTPLPPPAPETNLKCIFFGAAGAAADGANSANAQSFLTHLRRFFPVFFVRLPAPQFVILRPGPAHAADRVTVFPPEFNRNGRTLLT